MTDGRIRIVDATAIRREEGPFSSIDKAARFALDLMEEKGVMVDVKSVGMIYKVVWYEATE